VRGQLRGALVSGSCSAHAGQCGLKMELPFNLAPLDRRIRINGPICTWFVVYYIWVSRSMRNAAGNVLGTLGSKQLPPVSTWNRAAAANEWPLVAFLQTVATWTNRLIGGSDINESARRLHCAPGGTSLPTGPTPLQRF